MGKGAVFCLGDVQLVATNMRPVRAAVKLECTLKDGIALWKGSVQWVYVVVNGLKP